MCEIEWDTMYLVCVRVCVRVHLKGVCDNVQAQWAHKGCALVRWLVLHVCLYVCVRVYSTCVCIMLMTGKAPGRYTHARAYIHRDMRTQV